MADPIYEKDLSPKGTLESTDWLRVVTDLDESVRVPATLVAPQNHVHTEAQITDLDKYSQAEVNGLISGFFTDAPADTKQYARQDNAWAEVVSGGSGGIYVSPVSPDAAGINAAFTVSSLVYLPIGIYDISDGDVICPPGSILRFEAGARVIGTGTLTGQYSRIEAGREQIFDVALNVQGDWDIDVAYPEWFGALGDGSDVNNAPAINATINAFVGIEIKITGDTYHLGEPVVFQPNTIWNANYETQFAHQSTYFGHLLYIEYEPFFIIGLGAWCAPHYSQMGGTPITDWIIYINIKRTNLGSSSNDIDPRYNKFRKNSLIQNGSIVGPTVGELNKDGLLPKGMKVVSCTDTVSSGELVVGLRYYILDNSGGADFTGVGAPDNNVATNFVATGTTPTWGTGIIRHYGNASYFVDVRKLYVYRCQYWGIWTDGDPIAGMINTWRFDSVTIDGCLGGIYHGSRSAGHVWTSLALQPYTNQTYGAYPLLEVHSLYNSFDGVAWDMWYPSAFRVMAATNYISNFGVPYIQNFVQIGPGVRDSEVVIGDAGFLKGIQYNYGQVFLDLTHVDGSYYGLRVGMAGRHDSVMNPEVSTMKLITGGDIGIYTKDYVGGDATNYEAVGNGIINVNNLESLRVNERSIYVGHIGTAPVTLGEKRYVFDGANSGLRGDFATPISYPFTLFFRGSIPSTVTTGNHVAISLTDPADTSLNYMGIGISVNSGVYTPCILSVNGGTVNLDNLTSGYKIEPDTPFNIAVTFLSQSLATFYVNGRHIIDKEISPDMPINGSLTAYIIGKAIAGTGSTYRWEGEIGKVAVYDSALSPTDINKLFHGEDFATSGTKVVELGSQKDYLTWYDQSGNDYHASIIDTATGYAGTFAEAIPYNDNGTPVTIKDKLVSLSSSDGIGYDPAISSIPASTVKDAIDYLAKPIATNWYDTPDVNNQGFRATIDPITDYPFTVYIRLTKKATTTKTESIVGIGASSNSALFMSTGNSPSNATGHRRMYNIGGGAVTDAGVGLAGLGTSTATREFFAVFRDATTMFIYRDGSSFTKTDFTSVDITGVSWDEVLVASRADGTYPVDADIYRVGVWAKELTTQEMDDVRNNVSYPTDASLRGYWNTKKATALWEPDSVVGGNFTIPVTSPVYELLSNPLYQAKDVAFDNTADPLLPTNVQDVLDVVIGELNRTLGVKDITSDYTITYDDGVLLVDSTGGPITLTLPSPAVLPRVQYKIKDSGGVANSNNIVVAGTIDGVLNYTLNSAYESITLITDGTSWYII